MLVKYVKNQHRFSFNEDGTIKEGFINGKQLTEDELVEIKLAEKVMQEKLQTLNVEYQKLEEQKKEIIAKQQELAGKYTEEFEQIRLKLQEKVFDNYVKDQSSKEVQEWAQNNIFWWISRWI